MIISSGLLSANYDPDCPEITTLLSGEHGHMQEVGQVEITQFLSTDEASTCKPKTIFACKPETIEKWKS